MRVYVTQSIRELVSRSRGEGYAASTSSSTSPCDHHQQGQSPESNTDDTIEWDELKRIYKASGYAEKSISLEDVCRGGGIYTGEQNKVPPSTKSPQLVRHLEKLQKALDQKRYDEMVRCVTSKEKKWEDSTGFHSYREQMRYGAHVISMMGVFFAFGYALGWRLFDSMAYRAVCGIVSMFIAMVLECVLFILRSSRDVPFRATKKMNIPTTANTVDSVDKAKIE